MAGRRLGRGERVLRTSGSTRLSHVPEHLREGVRRRRRQVALRLGLLGLAVAGLAAFSVLRSGDEPGAAVAAAPDSGVLAASAGATWHWAGPAACTPATPAARLTRTAGGARTAVDTPLRTLTTLSAREDRLVALGRDTDCLPVLALSDDGGATWGAVPAAGLVDVRLVADGTVLAVRDDADGARVEEGDPDRLRPSTAECPGELEPRAVSDQGDRPYLLCEDDADVLRLLQRSTGGGWEYLTDTRPETGFDGRFSTRDLDVVIDGPGLLLSSSTRCPEGTLLGTRNGGGAWLELPCPLASLPGAVVLDLALAPDGRPYLLVLQAGTAAVVTSADNGRSWGPVPGRS